MIWVSLQKTKVPKTFDTQNIKVWKGRFYADSPEWSPNRRSNSSAISVIVWLTLGRWIVFAESISSALLQISNPELRTDLLQSLESKVCAPNSSWSSSNRKWLNLLDIFNFDSFCISVLHRKSFLCVCRMASNFEFKVWIQRCRLHSVNAFNVQTNSQ